MSYFRNVSLDTNNAAGDAFGRVRVSDPQVVFDSQLQYDKQPFLWVEKIAGSATSTHAPDESAVDMTVTTASGDSVIRQTREFFRYQPGKSQLCLLTFVMGAGQTGTTKLVGYGDANNGVFLGRDGTGVFILLRSSTSGAVSDARKIYQSSWNLDVFDGTGPSGVTADWTKTQILVVDLEWLGVGRVRVGLNIDGVTYYGHEFLNANTQTTTYMTTANLPVRYEITNDQIVSASATLKHVCSAVVSEGGQEVTAAYPFHAQTLGVAMGNGVANEEVVYALRHAATFNSIENRGKFIPNQFGVVAEGGVIVCKLLYNPTITGGAWASVGSSSFMEANTTATGYSGGTLIAGAIIPAGNANNLPPASQLKTLASRLPFGLDIDGANPITLALVAYGTGINITGDFLFDWEEIR